MASNPSLVPEIGPDGIAREAPVISYTEKIIEAEQLQLQKYIQENYSKIRDVERELANLSLEMKLTAGPKKAALELLRKKIETSTERIRVAKLKEDEARKMWESAKKLVQDEEATKQKLCEDLNNLVQESSNAQFARLEELKRRLEAMNPSRASVNLNHEGRSASSQDSNIQDGSSVPNARESSGGGSTESVPNQSNGQKVGESNGPNQLPPIEGEGRNKKKVNFHQSKGKGIGAMPKGRSSAPGWTGAGFDVDGRT